MKSQFNIFLVLLFLLFSSNCGNSSSGGPAIIDGPELNISEALSLEVNQLYVKNWSGGGTRPFFSVYIQDQLTKKYMTCAGPNSALDSASEAGVYYGNLSASMVQVAGTEDTNSPIFNVIIVSDQENPCPEPITAEDNIIGSAQVNFGNLVDSPIKFGESDAYVAFKTIGSTNISIPPIAEATQDFLTIEELNFIDSQVGDIIPNYYITLYISNGNTYIFHEMIDPGDMPEIRNSSLIYSWLGLTFVKTEGISTNENLLKTKARLEIVKDDGVLVGSTEPDYLGDMIGRKVQLLDGKGYIKFSDIY